MELKSSSIEPEKNSKKQTKRIHANELFEEMNRILNLQMEKIKEEINSHILGLKQEIERLEKKIEKGRPKEEAPSSTKESSISRKKDDEDDRTITIVENW